jgi:hypothetical protein
MGEEAHRLCFLRHLRLLRAALHLLALFLCLEAAAQSVVVTTAPDADAFVWSAAPDSNYGSAGALSVSGSSAVNGSGQQNGLFDSLMRFPTASVAATLNGVLGTASWKVTRSRLIVTEVAAPQSAIFNRGVGAFTAFLMASNSWDEGTGNPRMPTTDGVTWNELPGLVNSNLDMRLGTFTNGGVDGQIAFSLAPTAPFIAAIQQGRAVSLHLTATSPEIGFTFNSRNFTDTNTEPFLEVTAELAPKIDSIVMSNSFALVSFETVSNWSYRLQGAGALPDSGEGKWTDLLVVPASSPSGAAVYQDGLTNRQRFYRLSVSP